MPANKSLRGVGDTITTLDNKSYTITSVEFPDAGTVRYKTVSNSRYDNSVKYFKYSYDNARMSASGSVEARTDSPYTVTALNGRKVNLKTVGSDRYSVSATIHRAGSLYSSSRSVSFDSFDKACGYYSSISADPSCHGVTMGVKCGKGYALIDMAAVPQEAFQGRNDEIVENIA